MPTVPRFDLPQGVPANRPVVPLVIRRMGRALSGTLASLRLRGDAADRVRIGLDAADAPGLTMGSGATAPDVAITRPAAKTLGLGGTLLRQGGTVFPASPVSGDLFYRTDLIGWYQFDGTRWLSEQLYMDTVPLVVFPIPFTATTVSSHRMSVPLPGGVRGFWLDSFWLAFYVAGGGTALDASNKWVCDLSSQGASGTARGTITIDSGASTTWRNLSAGIPVQLAGTDIELEITCTKTGTPGGLYPLARVAYRWVAT